MIIDEYVCMYNHDGEANDEDVIVGGGEAEGSSILRLFFFHISLKRSAAAAAAAFLRGHFHSEEAKEMGDSGAQFHFV